MFDIVGTGDDHVLHIQVMVVLTQVSSWDLESGEIFAVLNWVLHIYTG